jgi:hypothetical protein
MGMGGPVDSERLTMLRDLIAALRAIAKEDIDTVNRDSRQARGHGFESHQLHDLPPSPPSTSSWPHRVWSA